MLMGFPVHRQLLTTANNVCCEQALQMTMITAAVIVLTITTTTQLRHLFIQTLFSITLQR